MTFLRYALRRIPCCARLKTWILSQIYAEGQYIRTTWVLIHCLKIFFKDFPDPMNFINPMIFNISTEATEPWVLGKRPKLCVLVEQIFLDVTGWNSASILWIFTGPEKYEYQSRYKFLVLSHVREQLCNVSIHERATEPTCSVLRPVKWSASRLKPGEMLQFMLTINFRFKLASTKH